MYANAYVENLQNSLKTGLYDFVATILPAPAKCSTNSQFFARLYDHSISSIHLFHEMQG